MNELKPEYVGKDNTAMVDNIQYFSYILNDGNCQKWLIKKVDTTSGTVTTWAKGEGDYATNWTARAGLTYSDIVAFDGRFF